MFLKKPNHKQFDYIPRYYNPGKDPDIKRREKLRFSTNVRRGKQPSRLKLILWFVVAVALYLLLSGKI